MADPIVHPHSEAEFDELIKKPTLTVVDWFATWCGPCNRIAPKLVEQAKAYPEVTFVKIDVDQMADLSAKWGVSAMPTFQYFKNGQKVDELVGASEVQLINKIKSNK